MGDVSKLTTVMEEVFEKVLKRNNSQEVAALIGSIVDARLKPVVDKLQAMMDEIEAGRAVQNRKLDIVTQLVSSNNKPKTPRATTTTTTTTTPDATAVKDAIETGNLVVIPSAGNKNNVKTRTVFWRQQYMNNQDFRTKYTIDNGTMNTIRNDEGVKKRKTDKTRDSKIADMVYQYIKSSCDDLNKKFE